MREAAPAKGGDSGVRWRSVTAAIAAISVVGIAIGLGIPLLSVILAREGHSATEIGLNTAVAGIASIAAAPLATPLAARFGVVWTMLAMIVLAAAAFAGFNRNHKPGVHGSARLGSARLSASLGQARMARVPSAWNDSN